MVGIVKRLRHACSLPSQQGELVADALSHMPMGSVSQIDEIKKNLVIDVNMFARLGVRLEDSPHGGFIVHHNSESCLVVEVKSKHHLDLPLMQLKDSLKINESFSLQNGVVEVSRKVVCTQFL